MRMREVVYHMVKEVYENFDLFKKQHPAFANLTPEKLTTRTHCSSAPGCRALFQRSRVASLIADANRLAN